MASRKRLLKSVPKGTLLACGLEPHPVEYRGWMGFSSGIPTEIDNFSDVATFGVYRTPTEAREFYEDVREVRIIVGQEVIRRRKP